MKKALRAALKGTGKGKALISEKRLFYAPYWRVKTMVYRWVFGKDGRGGCVKELKAKHLDRSFPAYQGIDLGLRSLGIRPGALTLPFFDRAKMAATGSIMKVDVHFRDAVDPTQMVQDVGLDQTNVHVHFERTRQVGQRYGLIYFPFWVIRLKQGQDSRILVVDAVANTVTRILTEERWRNMWDKRQTGNASIDFGQVSFIALKCPNCGWDLPVNRFDVIHFCRTCKRAWVEHGGRFRPVKFQIAEAPGDTDRDVVHLPFWVCEAEIHMNGQVLQTVGDLRRLAHLPPLFGNPNLNKERFRFFVPAARIRNILAADKLATGFTRQQPAYRLLSSDRLQDIDALGVFLSPQTAADMTDLLVCSLLPKGNRIRPEQMETTETVVRTMHLLLWPFYRQRLFLRDALSGLGIQKGTLGLS
jgi:hypothetical protein